MNILNKINNLAIKLNMTTIDNKSIEEIKSFLDNMDAELNDREFGNYINSLSAIDQRDFYKKLTELQNFVKSCKKDQKISKSDDILKSISWKPIKKGGYYYKNRELIKKDKDCYMYKSTRKAYIAPLMAIIIMVIILSMFAIFFNLSIIFPILIGSICYYITIKNNKKVIAFDKNIMYFYKDSIDIIDDNRYVDIKFTQFNNIHALQILEEYVINGEKRYFSYELNLVLKNGERINVIDHSNLIKIREEAQQLKKFLTVPVLENVKGII